MRGPLFAVGGITLLLLSCCLLPGILFRAQYGRGPAYGGTILAEEGMTATQVVELIGEPHKRYQEKDGDTWIYFTDAFAFGYDGVRLDAAGRVVSSWSH